MSVCVKVVKCVKVAKPTLLRLYAHNPRGFLSREIDPLSLSIRFQTHANPVRKVRKGGVTHSVEGRLAGAVARTRKTRRRGPPRLDARAHVKRWLHRPSFSCTAQPKTSRLVATDTSSGTREKALTPRGAESLGFLQHKLRPAIRRVVGAGRKGLTLLLSKTGLGLWSTPGGTERLVLPRVATRMAPAPTAKRAPDASTRLPGPKGIQP
jgi:hypothetical protein